MKIAVFGAGYVGLVTANCFAKMGNQVTCIDIDADKVAKLQQGICTIYEPGLEDLLAANLKSQNIVFTVSSQEAIANSEIIFIAVGTPNDDKGVPDLRYVKDVALTIARNLNGYKIIVNKSTVPVGSCKSVASIIQNNLAKKYDFDVVSNPEFLREGCAVHDCMFPDRIIVGSKSSKAIEILKQLYAPFSCKKDKFMVMDPASSELTKYAANAMLATKISFINEMSRIAECVEADIEHVRLGIGADPRIGYEFLYPGCGYGGSCFPKDVKALHYLADLQGIDAKILEAVEHINHAQKEILMHKIITYFNHDLSNKKIAIWGLSFKPNTDDIRDAPSIKLIECLLKHNVDIHAYDPQANANIAKLFKNIKLYDNPYETVHTADALVICTEWLDFRSPDFKKLRQELKSPVIFDGRNLFNLELMSDEGFDYYSIGRAPVLAAQKVNVYA
jgi:UDPglucose 6-dehydrogenase